MKLIRSLMGRHQFLIGAFMTSTLGLACKKLAGAASITNAAAMPHGEVEASTYSFRPAVTKGRVKRYSHLLSPLKIRNKILKNRMMHTEVDPRPSLGEPESNHEWGLKNTGPFEYLEPGGKYW